jgi:alpha-ketoglutarate-dependent 2,4-dichlorophenoxyacetate dioxygenase
MEHATQPVFVYRHHWTPRDLAIWDNRATMHRVMPYDHGKPRVMHRAEVSRTEYPA